MPGINGIELLKQIKQNWPQIEVIIITAHASVENAQNAIKYGAIDFLIKPQRVKELQEAVKRAIVKQRAAAKDYSKSINVTCPHCNQKFEVSPRA
jgi:DNA-binding NtrC family response regulator